MGIGVSVFLIALGAVLAFAVNVTTSGIDLDAVGVILMLVGAAGLLFSLLWWSDVMPWGRTTTRDTEYVTRHDDVDVVERPVTRRRVVERREY